MSRIRLEILVCVLLVVTNILPINYGLMKELHPQIIKSKTKMDQSIGIHFIDSKRFQPNFSILVDSAISPPKYSDSLNLTNMINSGSLDVS